MKTIPVTPFCGTNDYYYVSLSGSYEDRQEGCSVASINRNIKKELLNEFDLLIIDIIGNYRIINYNLIMSLVKEKYGFTISNNNNINNELLKLRKLGVIGMYRKDFPEQCVYILSEGANIYYHLTTKGEKRKRLSREFKVMLPADKVNHIVSINSLYINAHSSNDVKIKKHSIKYDIFRYISLSNKFLKVHFAALSIRRGDDLSKLLIDCYIKAEHYFKHNIYLILVCEDSKHIVEISRYIKNSLLLGSYQLYYTTDREASLNVFANLYAINKDSNSVYLVNLT